MTKDEHKTSKKVWHPLKPAERHKAFIPLVLTCLLIWFLYRLLFSFPVWFDESIGKLVFFGVPVALYSIIVQTKVVEKTMSLEKLIPGLYLGLAFGGLYGFVGLLSIALGKNSLDTAIIFLSFQFWWEFFLALLTGFWESLFFFGWIMTVAEKRFASWELIQTTLFTAFIFLLFHIPNIILRLPLEFLLPQMFLLTFFAIGQALIFHQYRNIYALTLSHAVWGMVLLVYGT